MASIPVEALFSLFFFPLLPLAFAQMFFWELVSRKSLAENKLCLLILAGFYNDSC